MSEEELLTSTEFAKAIGVSTSTVKTWDRENIVKPYIRMPSGKRLYKRSQVSDYFNKYKVGGDT